MVEKLTLQTYAERNGCIILMVTSLNLGYTAFTLIRSLQVRLIPINCANLHQQIDPRIYLSSGNSHVTLLLYVDI